MLFSMAIAHILVLILFASLWPTHPLLYPSRVGREDFAGSPISPRVTSF